jgi:hypothetical protein
MVEPTPSEVLHLGAKKRKLQRACDICRRRKGQSHTYAEETSGLIITLFNFLRSALYVPLTISTRVSLLGIDWHFMIGCRASRPLSLQIGDGPSNPANICTNCIAGKLDCTYNESKAVGPSFMPPDHLP